MHSFGLEDNEIVKINGIPYQHVGSGRLVGGTDPVFARSLGSGQVCSDLDQKQLHKKDCSNTDAPGGGGGSLDGGSAI